MDFDLKMHEMLQQASSQAECGEERWQFLDISRYLRTRRSRFKSENGELLGAAGEPSNERCDTRADWQNKTDDLKTSAVVGEHYKS